MSEREEYTPTMDEIKGWYAGAVDEYRCDTGMSMDEAEVAFDRAIAAHDRELREQIARDIEAHYLGPDSGRSFDGRDAPDAAERDAFDEGLQVASRIARGEGE